MNAWNEERFSELAMKVIARQSTDAERAELEALLVSDPALRSEYQRLQSDVRLAKELAPLVEGTAATQGEMPGYARGRLQTKVRQTLGRPAPEPARPEGPVVGTLLRWRWWLGLALAGAVAALLVIPPLVGPRRPVIELAMLDTAGATRGATNDALTLLAGTWDGSNLQQFVREADLKAWEAQWPAGQKGFVVKIAYDRTAGELRVVGRSAARSFTNSIPVDADLRAALAKAKSYLAHAIQP